MVDDLLKKGIIQLLEPKSPDEVGRTADLKYYRYHKMVSQKCTKLKKHIM